MKARSLLAGTMVLVTLVVAPPAASQAVPERPLGNPTAQAEARAGQRADTIIAAGIAPGADVVQVLPPWAAETVAALERRLAADVAADRVGSIAAAVVVDDRVVWAAAFGRADRDSGALASPTTVYRAGSITKPITALVLLALVERGVVALDDPVEPFLPELAHLANRDPDHGPIRFRDLATHTAGLAREPTAAHADRGPFRQWRRKVVDAVAATEAVDPPRRAYRYSNVGYALLGLALERAAGRPFEQLVQDLVFDPLGMGSSYFVVPPPERGRLAAGYVNPTPDSIDPRVPRAEHRGRGYRVPSGGAYSTVGDLGRLVMAMTGALGDEAVSVDARSAALTDGTGAADAPVASAGDGTGAGVARGAGYGLGFQLQRIGDTVIAGHSGAAAGYTAYLAFDPATRVGVILLRNYNHGSTNLGATAVGTILDLAERAPAGAVSPSDAPAR